MDTTANVPIAWYMTTSTTVGALTNKRTDGFAGDPNLPFGPFVPGLASNVKQAVTNLTIDWQVVLHVAQGPNSPDASSTRLFLAKEKAVLMTNFTLPASSQAIVRTPPCAQSCEVSLAPRLPHYQTGPGQAGLWYQLTSYSNLNNSETVFFTSEGEVEAGPFWNAMSCFISSVNLDIGTVSQDNMSVSGFALIVWALTRLSKLSLG